MLYTSGMNIRQISAAELAARLQGGDPPVLLDVREPHEREVSKLANDVSIPMGEVLARMGELDKSAEIVVYCRTGGRSNRVAEALISSGFSNVSNLAGGINGWAATIDPSLPQY